MKSIDRGIAGTVFAFFAALLVLASFPKGAAACLTAKANHDHIKIDFFYHGSTVSVSGSSDPGTDLIIKLTAPDGHEALKRKGKVGGILWMNVGDIKLENVPDLYYLRSTRKCEEMLCTEDMEKNVIGYPALEGHACITPASCAEEKAKWFGEFVRFKENSRLYYASSGGISLTSKEGRQSYYTLFQWPYQAPPGDYIVTVYAVKGGKIVEQAQSKVLVEQVGTVKYLADMSKTKGALYGSLSIAVALLSGFGVGIIFRKGGGAH